MSAEDHLARVMKTVSEHNAVACDAAAREYLSVKKDAERYQALRFAANDWRELGRLLPSTRQLLRTLGIGEKPGS